MIMTNIINNIEDEVKGCKWNLKQDDSVSLECSCFRSVSLTAIFIFLAQISCIVWTRSNFLDSFTKSVPDRERLKQIQTLYQSWFNVWTTHLTMEQQSRFFLPHNSNHLNTFWESFIFISVSLIPHFFPCFEERSMQLLKCRFIKKSFNLGAKKS